jgi:guanine deaminase
VDPKHAAVQAALFVDQLLSNGTTTALVFGSSHKTSVQALFEEVFQQGMRLIAAARRGRLGYAVTPRFALTSSREQLAMAGQILRDHPQVWIQTHLAETVQEGIEAMRQHPEASDYLNIYERAGLVTSRSVFAHCVQMDESGFSRLAAAVASIAHCPSSKLFLGSGLFPLKRACACDVKVGIGNDFAGGDSFSIPRILNQAYKVAQLLGDRLDPYDALYMATLGGARALGLGNRIGSLEAGKEADFLILDPANALLLARRLARPKARPKPQVPVGRRPVGSPAPHARSRAPWASVCRTFRRRTGSGWPLPSTPTGRRSAAGTADGC